MWLCHTYFRDQYLRLGFGLGLKVTWENKNHNQCILIKCSVHYWSSFDLISLDGVRSPTSTGANENALYVHQPHLFPRPPTDTLSTAQNKRQSGVNRSVLYCSMIIQTDVASPIICSRSIQLHIYCNGSITNQTHLKLIDDFFTLRPAVAIRPLHPLAWQFLKSQWFILLPSKRASLKGGRPAT